MFLCVNCSSGDNMDETFTLIDIEEVPIRKVTLGSLYSEIEFIPLENNSQCMLNRVSKIVPVKDGYCVFNKSSLPSIILFDNKGRFKCHIGRLGKAKGEFQNNVLSITSDREGDTIVVSTFDELLAFNNEGHYLFSKKYEFGIPFDIEKYNEGYVVSSDYHGTDYTLHVLNDKFEIRETINPSNKLSIPNWGITNNPIRVSDGLIYFYNQYNSMFSCVDPNNNFEQKSFRLKSKNMISLSDFTGGNDPFENDVDIVFEYSVHNGVIMGNIILDEKSYDFELDIREKTMKLYDVESWFPRNDAFYDGYIITILPQDEFVSLGSSNNRHVFDGVEICNFDEIYSSVSKLDNFVIAKLKRRQ